MASTTNMNLTTWGPNDYFNDLELKENWEKLDAHNHDPSSDGGVQIGTNGLVNNVITTAKLDDDAVTGDKIANNTITKFKLANDLLVALEKAAEALSIETVFGTGTTSDITGDYETLQIKQGAIVNTHISNTALISPSKLDIRTQSGTLLSNTNPVIDANASAGGDVFGPFNSLSIQSNAIGPAELASSAVTTAKIDNSAVTSAKIADGTITTTDLASSVVSGLTNTPAGWSGYTPTLTTFGGSVTTSNVGIGGAWQKVHNTVVARIELNVGTYLLTGNGTLALLFGLPVQSVGRVSGSWWADIYIASSPTSIESYSGSASAGSGASACALRGVSTLGATSSLARPNLSVGYTDGGGSSYPQALWVAGSNLTITVTYQV